MTTRITAENITDATITTTAISGTTLTFQGGAPASGVAIQIRELPA